MFAGTAAAAEQAEDFPMPGLSGLPAAIRDLCPGNDYLPGVPVTLPFDAGRIRLRSPEGSPEEAAELFAEYRVEYSFEHSRNVAVFYSVFRGLSGIRLKAGDRPEAIETLAGYAAEPSESECGGFTAGFYSKNIDPFLCHVTRSRPVYHEGLYWYSNSFYTVSGFLNNESNGLLYSDLSDQQLKALLSMIKSRQQTGIASLYLNMRVMMEIEEPPAVSNPDYLPFLSRTVIRGLLPADAVSSYKYSQSRNIGNARLLFLFDETQLADIESLLPGKTRLQIFGCLTEYDTENNVGLLLVSRVAAEDLNEIIKKRYGF